jgi:hypothetical protein
MFQKVYTDSQELNKTGAILLYKHYKDFFDHLSDAQAGSLIKSALKYQFEKDANANPYDYDIDANAQVAFTVIKRDIDKNNQRYEKVSKVRAESAAKRWAYKRNPELKPKKLLTGSELANSYMKCDTCPLFIDKLSTSYQQVINSQPKNQYANAFDANASTVKIEAKPQKTDTFDANAFRFSRHRAINANNHLFLHKNAIASNNYVVPSLKDLKDNDVQDRKDVQAKKTQFFNTSFSGFKTPAIQLPIASPFKKGGIKGQDTYLNNENRIKGEASSSSGIKGQEPSQNSTFFKGGGQQRWPGVLEIPHSNECRPFTKGTITTTTRPFTKETIKDTQNSTPDVNEYSSLTAQILATSDVFRQIDTQVKEPFKTIIMRTEFVKPVFNYFKYRKQIKKPFKSAEQLMIWIKRLKKISQGSFSKAIEAVEKTIRNGWLEIF